MLDNEKYLLWNDPGGNTTITVIHVMGGASSRGHAMLMPAPWQGWPGRREPGQGAGGGAERLCT